MSGERGEKCAARRAALARLEARVADALRAPDPTAAFAAIAADRSLPPSLRRRVGAASADGVRMAALLVTRLRFERLLRGSPEAEAWFERDASAFSAAFRRYHAEVPPTGFFPAAEADLFRKWRAARAGNGR